MGGVSEEGLLDALDEAMAARVVSDVPGGPGRLRFAHVLIRDTLYEGLTTARRARLHRQVVEALEAFYGDERDPTSPNSRTTPSPDATSQGLRYARRAGDRRRAPGLRGGGAPVPDRARRARPGRPGDENARCELLLSLGEREAQGTAQLQRARSSRRPRSRGGSTCRASSPARPPGTAGGCRGRGPGATSDSCRSSRRARRDRGQRTSHCGPGCWHASRGRFETSTRGIDATG